MQTKIIDKLTNRQIMKYLYLFLALLCASQGQAQLKSYHYRQELQGVQPHHWHQLSLPSTVFQHLESGYDDLRIYGVSATDTIEVPYSIDKTNYIDTESRTSYTDSVAQKLSVPFNVQQLKKEKQTLISLALPHTLRLSKIAFTINANYDYFRKVKVLKRYTASQESDPYNEDSTLLFSDVLSSKTPNAFYFRTQLIKYIQIIIDNADNQPLPIAEIVVSAVPYTLKARFGSADYTYYLAYGKWGDYAPVYDITYFPKDIPTHPTSITFGKITDQQSLATAPHTATATTQKADSKQLLWWVMGGIVVLIFIFATKMIKSR